MRPQTMLFLICAVLLSGLARGQAYPSVKITAPEAETTIFDNSGSVTVQVSLIPALRAGDSLALVDNGTTIASSTTQQFQLEDLDRGAHTMVAQVIGRDGSVLASSPPLTFYMWRASALFPNRRH